MMNKPPMYNGTAVFFFPRPWLDEFCLYVKENWNTKEVPLSQIFKKTGLTKLELPWGIVPFWYRLTKEQTYNLVWKEWNDAI